MTIEEKRKEALRALLEKEGLGRAEPEAIPPRPPGETLPAAYAQERIWYVNQFAPGLRAYNIPLAFRLEGPLDVEKLQQSIRAVVARHEALRTTLVFDGEKLFQKVHPEPPFTVHFRDLSRRHPDIIAHDVRNFLRIAAQQRFDPAEPPLFEVSIIRESETVHYLLATFHHLIADGWSLRIFLREVSAFYTGVGGQLPEPVQYGDFAVWQRARIADGLLDRQTAYWEQQLGGEIPSLRLPFDHPRPARQAFKGQWTTWQLDPALSDRLEQLARTWQTTQLVVYLAGFKALLHRYTGQQDIIVGSPVTHRSRLGLEHTIGNFINTQVLRTEIDSALSFRAIIDHVRETVLQAYEHQDIPLELLLERLDIPRDLSSNPLFQVVFILQDNPAQGSWRTALDLPGVQAEFLFSHSGSAKFDLTFELEKIDGEMHVSIEHNTELFAQETVERMFRHYTRFLKTIANDPEAPVASIRLNSPEEARALLSWGNTGDSAPAGETVQALFEETVARLPDRTALTLGEERLTYTALNRRANRLAHRLIALGVGPETRVGLVCERSLELVAGILAVLKAGGVYVPLDPEYPPARLKFMMLDAEIEVLLLQKKFQGKINGPRQVFLDEPLPPDTPDHNPPNAGGPDHLAYVMYTSGTTGSPKGTAIPHRGILRLVRETNYLDFGPEDVFLLFSPISFDASTLEIWGALLNGARLAIFPPGRPSLQEMGAVFAREEVSVLWLTAGLFHLMVEQTPESLRNVRWLLTGGDVVSPAHVRQILPVLRDGVVINGYGPTENTTFTTTHRMEDPDTVPEPVPIGKPVSGTQVLVLDRSLQLVPPGVAGELYTSGAGLARGYLNQPGQTAAAFLPNPYGPPGSRIYRTGDLARWRRDGTLDFLGRADSQIKIRGHRVELGEIEKTLNGHPGVQQTLVVAGRRKELIAYVRPAEKPVQPDVLRSYLQDALPKYMLPDFIVPVSKFQITPNGKIDRTALPEPQRAPNAFSSDSHPANELEANLARIWQDVLELESIRMEQNFFEAGGNSLSAMRLIYQIESELERQLSITALFQNPTIRSQAALFKVHMEEALWSPTVLMQQGEEDRKLYLVPPGGATVLTFREMLPYLEGSITAIGLQPWGLEGQSRPDTSVAGMAAKYIQEIRKIQPEGPYRLAGTCFGGLVVFEMARQFEKMGETVDFLGVIDTLILPEWDLQTRLRLLIDHYYRHYVRDTLVSDYKIFQIEREFQNAPLEGEELTRQVKQILFAHTIAGIKYVGKHFGGKVTYFQCTGLAPIKIRPNWPAYAESVETIEIEGNHFGQGNSFLDEPHVWSLGRELSSAFLDAAGSSDPR